MNCEDAQNRLLAVPDAKRVSAELREHLAGCAACRAYLAAVGRLDELLTAVPVPPPSAGAKTALMDKVADAGPIITHVPVVPRRDSAVNLRALTKNGRWRYAAGLAAAALIATGGALLFSGRNGTNGQKEAAYHHRSELLRQVVERDVALAKATTPQERMAIWAGVTGDVWAEASKVARVADARDMNDLAGMFDRAAKEGLLRQADLLPDTLPADQRQQLARKVSEKLTEAENEASRLAQESPQHSQAPLKKIAQTARAARIKLEQKLGKGA